MAVDCLAFSLLPTAPCAEESMKDAGWPPDVMTYRIMLEGHIEAWLK